MNKNAANGAFRKRKVYFTQVSNNALRDENLSLKAKGLYALIQSYITIEDFTLYKSTLKKQCLEGEKAFESTWKELKDKGYLVQYKLQDEVTKQFYYEYDLLEVAEIQVSEDKSQNPKKEGVAKVGSGNGRSAKRGVYNNTDSNNTDLNNTYSNKTSKEKLKESTAANVEDELSFTSLDNTENNKSNLHGKREPIIPDDLSVGKQVITLMKKDKDLFGIDFNGDIFYRALLESIAIACEKDNVDTIKMQQYSYFRSTLLNKLALINQELGIMSKVTELEQQFEDFI